MSDTWKQCFSSKKFVGMVTGIIAMLLAVPLQKWLGMDAEQAQQVGKDLAWQIAAIVAAYQGGQGLADWGKEAAKEANGNGSSPPEPESETPS